jgi:hypothetical protein
MDVSRVGAIRLVEAVDARVGVDRHPQEAVGRRDPGDPRVQAGVPRHTVRRHVDLDEVTASAVGGIKRAVAEGEVGLPIRCGDGRRNATVRGIQPQHPVPLCDPDRAGAIGDPLRGRVGAVEATRGELHLRFRPVLRVDRGDLGALSVCDPDRAVAEGEPVHVSHGHRARDPALAGIDLQELVARIQRPHVPAARPQVVAVNSRRHRAHQTPRRAVHRHRMRR